MRELQYITQKNAQEFCRTVSWPDASSVSQRIMYSSAARISTTEHIVPGSDLRKEQFFHRKKCVGNIPLLEAFQDVYQLMDVLILNTTKSISKIIPMTLILCRKQLQQSVQYDIAHTSSVGNLRGYQIGETMQQQQLN